MKKRVFLYVRVSSQEQAREGYSIKEQETRLRAYAESKDYTVVKVFTDPGYTGANIDRPGLQEMIKEIQNVDLVLVYKLDRLSRSQKDTLYLIEDVFMANGVDFSSLSESFDTSTPFGRAMIGILSVFAQLEREQIKERIMMGKEARAKDGYWHGGGAKHQVLTGYDYVNGELIVNEYEAECIKYIYSEYAKGKGVDVLFREVTEKFPNVITSAPNLRRLLAIPTLKGVIHFQGKEYPGRHEAIVTPEQYETVQRLIEKRTSKSDPFRREYLLTGLLFCGHCGARICGRNGGKLKNGTPMRYYVCYTRHGSPKHMMTADSCMKKYERKEQLEEIIANEIKKINLRKVEIADEALGSKQKKLETLETQLKKIDAQISKTVDLFSIGNIPMEILTEKIDKLNEDKEKLKTQIEDLKVEDKTDMKLIKETLSQLPEFDSLENDTKRVFIANLINKITLYNDDIVIEWAF